jgi:hypothetical protein
MQRLKIAETPLEKAVQAELNRQAREGSVEGVLRDLMRDGCASGAVSSMMYYRDTLRFYKRHAREIDGLLAELCAETGDTPAQLFSGWDTEDPLALGTQNQNLLAWFGFEETARRLAERAGIEV